MGNLMKKLKKTKMVKQFGILSLVLAMLIGVMSNGTIINAVDGNADANITFNSRIVEKVNGQDVDVSQADSGDSFFLAIYYAVSASTDASKYTECTLSITLPNDIEFDETTDISNTGFDSIEQRTSLGKNILSIKSKELAAGQSGTLYLKMHFKNMTTKNGTTAKFVDMKMTGSMVNENGSYTINPVSVPDVSVTAKASQEWTVGKNVIQQADGNNYTIKSIDGKDYYSVDYKVTAAPGSNLTDLGNNYGRLNCTTFELVDTLPVAPAGREDGGAANISIKVGDKVLEEGADKDYELVLNENGTVKAIKIYYISTYESNPDDTNYVPDGAAMLTTYTINANYSKDAYRVLPNEKDDIPFILDNKVELKYLPLGENTPKYVSANAPVNVGWVDENAPTTNLDITKYVTVNGDNNIVGDNKFIFDQEKQDCYYQNTDSRIAFGLYTDEACQNAATDIDGNTVGNSKVIDKDGKVNFAKISEGTYYLKETVGNLPFIGDGVDSANGETIYKIEVKNENNKAVVYLDGKKIENGKLEINNLTTAQGFGYVAFNKVGTSATNSQYGPLAGVKFILTNKVTGDKYETVSNDKGLVLFEGIIAGDYTVEEDFSSAEYDKPDVYKWDVKVEANKVNYPSLMLQDHNTGVPYVVNSSNKGKLIINKVDALTETKKLNGAEFTVYGPFESKETANIAIESEDFSSVDSFTLNGNEESKALVKGFYVYQETKAPNHYKLDENYYVTELKTQTLNEVTVKNEELGYLQILKKGSLKDYPTITVNLAGAKFHVYTNKNATDDSLVKDDAGNPIVIESNNSVSSS
ncbi:SpaA isopeptide-forming pilin-related protein [Erysipelatoclostridium ramosum]|uniref:MSCRAMM family protein n=1 Tax=Thomasclavelia ramosa TaxID=1547 RepID=UPI001E3E5C18|nr:SpaA isopeptide-forming pilin-related protein [Thomasclavelia ramosa]MDB7038231.1 SpaA isopeptide-forming pilin-related protein [Thomasclavelia ramosa]